jgi:hypothetical protein
VMLNHFIGRGGPSRFHVTQFDPASSLLEPDAAFLDQFVALPSMCAVVKTEEIITSRLDDIAEISDCDFLKLDVQGGEMEVLRGAPRLLKQVVCIHSEVEFAPLYKGQCLFAEIDTVLRAAGFELIDLMNAGYAQYKALERSYAQSRLLWSDAVYFRSPATIGGPEKLLAAALIAHVNYGMYDVAAHYLAVFDRKTGRSTLPIYSQALRTDTTLAGE